MEGQNTTSPENYVFLTLHGYGVTIQDLFINILIVILGAWIILLNCLLLDTLIRWRNHLEVTDIFICSFAINDFLIGLLLLYNTSYNIANYQIFEECIVRFGFIQATLLNSTLHISILTANRYIKILKPYHYNKIFKKRYVILTSVSMWCSSLIVGSLPIMGWNSNFTPEADDNKQIVCRYFGVMSPGYLLLNVILFWVPVVIMVVLYAHICKIAHNHARAIAAQELVGAAMSGNQRNMEGRSWKFTKTVLIIIGVYFFCWVPTGIIMMLQISGSLDNFSLTIKGNILVYTSSLGFLNSFLNPIIYACKIGVVKRRFQRTLCCKKSIEVTDDTMIFTKSTHAIRTIAS